MAAPPDPPSPAARRRVDRYELLDLVGQGGFGGVYRARHVHTQKLVALKLARAEIDADAAARVLAEGRAAGALAHPNVVGVLDGGISDRGEAFVVMELLDGISAEELLAREGPLDPHRAVSLGLQILSGLAAAHARGIVHRDVKPSNVFVVAGPQRAEPVVKIIDFGISKLPRTGTTSAPSPTRTGEGYVPYTLPGVAMGTPGYMAPEQLSDARSVDARADVYAVGAMLFEMLTGRKPIEPEGGLEVWIRRLTTESAPPLASMAPHVPAALGAVIDRALARDRDARWRSAEEMQRALASAVADRGRSRALVAPAAQAPQTLVRAAERPRALAWAFAIFGVVVAVASVAAVAAYVASLR